MTASLALTDALDASAVEGISRGEPAWLGALRADWWRRVEADPWPTGAEEEWRRTSLDGLPRDGGLLLDPPTATYELDPILAERGVIFSDLTAAIREHGDLVRSH